MSSEEASLFRGKDKEEKNLLTICHFVEITEVGLYMRGCIWGNKIGHFRVMKITLVLGGLQ